MLNIARAMIAAILILTATAAQGKVRIKQHHPNAIPNQYLVMLAADGTNGFDVTIDNLAESTKCV